MIITWIHVMSELASKKLAIAFEKSMCYHISRKSKEIFRAG